VQKHSGQNQALATILDLGQVLLGIQENQALVTILDLGQVLLGIQEDLVLLLEKKLELAYLELEV